MSIVQRCPNCGTTKATAGECEACHEEQVRYFCTDHTPGLWLDASTCPKCGARFGDPARAASAPEPPGPARSPAPAIPRLTRSPAPARRPAPAAARPPLYSRVGPPKATADPWGRRKRLPWADEVELEPGGSRIALWQKILQAAIRARYMPSTGALSRERRLVRRGAGGCLMRLLLGAVLVFLMLASGVFMFGRALLQGY